MMPLKFQSRLIQHLHDFDSTDRKIADRFLREYESLPITSKIFHLMFRTDRCARYFAAINSYVNPRTQTEGEIK